MIKMTNINNQLTFRVNGVDIFTDLLSHGGIQDQDPDMEINSSNRSVKITGNGWKYIPSEFNITADTVISFDYQQIVEGEVHGLGFDNDNKVSFEDRASRLQLGGTQPAGISNLEQFITQTVDGVDTYEIPVGQFFTGDYSRLVLINDHDVNNPTASATYSNIELFEKPQPKLPYSVDGVDRLTDLLSHGGHQDQNPDVEIDSSNRSVKITGNGWKYIPGNFNITPDTVISFDYQQIVEGEVHGLGFDNDNKVSFEDRASRLQLGGTQPAGISNLEQFITQTVDGVDTYEIPVGQFFTGDYSRLVLINDHDVNNPTASATYSNIELFEKPQPKLPYSVDGVDRLTDLLSHGGHQDQNPDVEIDSSNRSVKITGNGWKYIPGNFNITPDTVISFDYQQIVEGEVHGLGFDNDNKVSFEDRASRLQLGGTQPAGISNLGQFITQTVDGVDTYEIPVGQFFTGDYSRLVLINDHDVNNPTASATYSNIELFEKPQPKLPYSVDGVDRLTDLLSHGGHQDQNPDVEIDSSNRSVKITGNGWKYIPGNFNITPDTVISFDYQQIVEGEVHGLGFDNDNKVSFEDRASRLQLGGTQPAGISNLEQFITQTVDGVDTYEIPVGQFFTGNYSRLVLINDHDVNNPTASATYSNIELFEDTIDYRLRKKVQSLLSNDDIVNIETKIFNEYPQRAATWTDDFDWSGVNWASQKAGTAITPDIVVSASHFGGIPNSLEFITEDGTVITRSVIGAVNVGNDVRVSRLNEPLPSEVKIYQLPDPSISYSELEGGLSIYTNRGRTAHAGVISPISGKLADLNRDTSIPSNLWDELEGGDSGSPAFILGSNNEEVLFTTWWFNSESGPYYGDSDIQLAINNGISQLGSPYTFETNLLI